MTKRILIIGGYGNFGRFIAQVLAQHNLELIIAGRNLQKAQRFAEQLKSNQPIHACYLDIYHNLDAILLETQPDIVIHTTGPFQGQSYLVAKTCIKHACHYIDLADARQFVSDIATLDNEAIKNNILVVSGASSVPTLTCAIINNYKIKFSKLDTIEYAISTAQDTTQGIATVRAIMSYIGKPFSTLLDGKTTTVYGWQPITKRQFWGLGPRFLGYCDIPDLTLFPKCYANLKTIHFRAGISSKLQHSGLYLLSWLVRLKLFKSLQPFAVLLQKLSIILNKNATNGSGFYMELSGLNHDHKKQTIRFDLVARNGDGLYIPCIPAIIMAQKLASGTITTVGAKPCMDFISLNEYLTQLQPLNISCKSQILE